MLSPDVAALQPSYGLHINPSAANFPLLAARNSVALGVWIPGSRKGAPRNDANAIGTPRSPGETRGHACANYIDEIASSHPGFHPGYKRLQPLHPTPSLYSHMRSLPSLAR